MYGPIILYFPFFFLFIYLSSVNIYLMQLSKRRQAYPHILLGIVPVAFVVWLKYIWKNLSETIAFHRIASVISKCDNAPTTTTKRAIRADAFFSLYYNLNLFLLVPFFLSFIRMRKSVIKNNWRFVRESPKFLFLMITTKKKSQSEFLRCIAIVFIWPTRLNLSNGCHGVVWDQGLGLLE